jgi:Skp family chaperone for outer membrane proteins
MKKIILILTTFSFFLLTLTPSISSEKIIFIDFDFIVNNSNHGKVILKTLKSRKEENIKELKLDEKNIKDEENDIKIKKDILSEEEINKKIISLNNNIKKFQTKKKSMNSELNKLQNEKMNNFINQINSILEAYMKDQSVDIMLNSKHILIGKKTINKTEDILKLINQKIK